MFTPIHRALGLEPGNLTMNDINQVIAEKVEETADLDWKESVYDNRDPNWSEEAAKDIAAMANSGGGWIVFGIGDDRKNNAASSVNPIQWAAGNDVSQTKPPSHLLIDCYHHYNHSQLAPR